MTLVVTMRDVLLTAIVLGFGLYLVAAWLFAKLKGKGDRR